ncbi:hypothetical protein L6R50_18425 [Myxococcota bacterium]|nr:hypothetical protein [Myxococcota bacterium]
MSPVRIAIALLGAVAATSTVVPTSRPVHAATHAAAGDVHLLPPGPILADGSAQTLAVLLFDAEGNPVRDASFRGSRVGVGHLGPSEMVGPGVYVMPLQAPASAQVRTAPLTLKARWGTSTVERAFEISFAPPPPVLEAAIAPDHLVLGLDAPQQAVVTVVARGPGGGPATGVRLVATANAGTVGDFVEREGGRYEAVYSPPTETHPQVALIAVADADRPESGASFLALPLWGVVHYPLDTGRADARLVFHVGGHTFGPYLTDAAGRAEADIQVPPGVPSARIAIENPGGAKESLDLNLNAPPFPRLSFAPAPPYTPADGRRVLPLRFQVTDPHGRPDAKARVKVAATSGEVLKPVAEGKGLFRVDYVPPAVAAPATVSISATLDGDPASSQDSVTLDIVPAPPTGLRGTVTPWPPTGSTLALAAAVLDAFDRPSPRPDVQLRGWTGTGSPTPAPDSATGRYELVLPGDTPSIAWAAPLAHGRAAHTLLAIPLDDQLTPGGPTGVLVQAIDRLGLAVPGVPITARVLRGTARVGPATATDDRGFAVFQVDAGALGGPQEIRFEAGGLKEDLVIWQSRQRSPEIPAFPLHGGATRASAARSWRTLSARFDPSAGTTDLQPPAEQRGAGGTAR